MGSGASPKQSGRLFAFGVGGSSVLAAPRPLVPPSFPPARCFRPDLPPRFSLAVLRVCWLPFRGCCCRGSEAVLFVSFRVFSVSCFLVCWVLFGLVCLCVFVSAFFVCVECALLLCLAAGFPGFAGCFRVRFFWVSQIFTVGYFGIIFFCFVFAVSFLCFEAVRELVVQVRDLFFF